jgi:hypothetical protein
MLSSVITGVYELSGLPLIEGPAQPFAATARQLKLSILKVAGNKSLICPIIFNTKIWMLSKPPRL